MKKLALLLAFLLLAGASPAMAWIHGVPSSATPQVSNLMVFQGGIAWPGMGTGAASPACPQGSGFPSDGCAGANSNATFQESNAFQSGGYFNTTAATSTNYMAANCGASGTASCRPAWNVAGVDYKIGNYTAPSAMLDPATMSLPGCAYSTTASGTGGNIFSCGNGHGTGTFAGLLQHINFGPVTGAGAHGCTALRIDTTTGLNTVLIDDVYFFNDTGLCSEAISNDFVFSFNGIYTGGITVQNFYMDGNSSVWNNPYGGCSANTICNADVAIAEESSPVTIKYGVMKNFAVHEISGGITGAGSIQYSWIEGWAARGPDSHSEFYDGAQGSAGVAGEKFDYDVVLPRADQAQFGPSPIFWASNYPFSIGAFQLTNSTILNAFIGSGTKTATTTGCVGATYSGGCSGAGHIYFVTANTGTIGTGQNLNCTSGSVVINKPITGSFPSGVIAEWNVDGQGANQFWDIVNPGTGTTFQIGPLTCTSVPMIAGTANIAVMSGDANTPFGSVTVENNYIDPTSATGSTNSQDLYDVGQIFGNTAVASGTITTTGGVSTLTTSVVVFPKNNAFVVASTIDGCGGNNLGCPTIASGSGTTYILSTAVTPVGPIAMSLQPLAWCSAPAVFSGNVDMSGLTSDTRMNEWSTTTQGSGVAIGC